MNHYCVYPTRFYSELLTSILLFGKISKDIITIISSDNSYLFTIIKIFILGKDYGEVYKNSKVCALYIF